MASIAFRTDRPDRQSRIRAAVARPQCLLGAIARPVGALPRSRRMLRHTGAR
jgi:hypothetical protein